MTTDYIKKVLNYCIERQEKIKIDYVNNYGRKSTRTIQPIGIREERDLVSCNDSISGEERTFKITKIKILELPKALKDMQNLSNSSEDMVEENNTSPDFEENVNITNTMDDLNKTFNKDDSINHAHVEKVIDELRRQLLDLTKRNNLINHNHSARSTRFIRVIDELPNILYTTIKDKKMYFKPLPGIEEEPEDEKSNDFKMKYEAMKLEDEEYLKEISRLEEKNDKKENVEELEKIERKLKDKVRKELGLPEIKRGSSLNLANHAKSHKFNPNYDLPIPNQEEHDELHADNKIQTLLLPENLKSLINKIYSQHNNFKQNMGVNLLRVSYGYLEWYESESSDVACHAPLLMMPVELIREKNIGTMRYALTSQQEEAEVNSALIEKLKEFQIKLPEFEEEDDPESYFIKVTKAVEKKARWKVRRYVTIGIYSFNKVAQFHDLNPENWKEGHFLTGHDAIATLLAGKGVGDSVGGVLDESFMM